jgi:hypothetical protein
MKHFQYLMLVLLLSSCASPSKDPAKTVSGRNSENGAPAFEIKEEIHNFGKLLTGEVVVYSFTYRNAGTTKLEIVRTEAGCSCMSVEPVEKVVKPGESGTIQVIFNTSGLYGKQFQSCRVFSSKEGITMDIAVTAEVMSEEIELKQP